MIQVTNLTKVFRGETDVTALTGINLNVDDGDIYGIIGMSGAGKSTLLRCIALLETPTQGRIEVDGVDISTLQGKDLTALRKSVGVIFQGYNLLMQRNVLRNVCFPLELDGVKKEAREARALELLNVVGLADKARAYPAQLSGGQKQRVAIAGALAMEPEVLLMDEPTAMLDPGGRREVMETVERLHRESGLTVVLVTHFMDEALRGDRVIAMQDGKAILEGAPREVFAREAEALKAAGLEVPAMAELTSRLRARGLDVQGAPMTVPEMAQALLARYRERGASGNAG